jgi:GrpB-like predicted nucleotidyltransferase (UPF0157 family)
MESIVRPILIADYDPEWPALFTRVCSFIEPALAGLTCRIEHVGSTAVPGLAAKPIIDLDVVVASSKDMPVAIERLQSLGYAHEGDLGVAGREAFRAPAAMPGHHLYLCAQDSAALANHLAVRDALRADPVLAQGYGRLKRRLAKEAGSDIARYVEGKTAFLRSILRASGLDEGPRATLIAR